MPNKPTANDWDTFFGQHARLMLHSLGAGYYMVGCMGRYIESGGHYRRASVYK